MKKKLIAILSVISIVAIGALAAPYFVNDFVESKIDSKLDEVLVQSISYEKIKISHWDNEIEFNDVTLFDRTSNESRYNAKAKNLKLYVDFKNALSKNFQVKRITADDVVLNFNYTSKGQSNFHNIQQNIRDHLKLHRSDDSNSSSWDIYDITMTNITVKISDAEIGEIGTFRIPELVLPRISSMYQKENNRDILLASIGKTIISQMISGTLDGEYSKMKLLAFTKREALSESSKLTGKLKLKLLEKAKFMAAKLAAQ